MRRGSRRSPRRRRREDAGSRGAACRASASLVDSSDASRSARRSLTARDSSSLRAGASPNQNGMLGGAPFASATRTTPVRTCRMRQDMLPSWKMSPAHALDGEVLVERADERLLRLEHDPVVGDLGDRAAGGDREHARAAAAADGAVHFVAMQQRAAASALASRILPRSSSRRRRSRRASGRDTARRVARARTARLRRSRSHAASATICCASTSSGASCDDDAIELAALHGAQQRRAFDEVVARRSGRAGLSAVPRRVWPERPTRCRNVAMRCGEPSWQTRSTCRCRCPAPATPWPRALSAARS